MSERPTEDLEGPGATLRRRREARGLLVHDVAQELHLDPWMIEALEADEFEALGAPVFAKGHLRQYGTLLGLPTDDLMIAYYRVRGRSDTAPPPITTTIPKSERRRGLPWGGLLLALIVVAALAALLWMLSGNEPETSSREPGSSPGATRASEPPAGSHTDLPLRAPPLQSGTDRADTPVVGEAAEVLVDTMPEAAQPAADAEGPAGEGAVAVVEAGDEVELSAAQPGSDVAERDPGEVQLRMVFSGESWVEVTDRDGRRVVYGMYAAGRTRLVTANAPVEVFLGRNRDVSIEVNGVPYAIAAESIRGNTARFVIPAQSR